MILCVPGCNFTNNPSVACNCNNLLNASDVFLFAICSSHRPKDTKVNNIGGVSKNVLGLTKALSAKAINRTVTYKETANANS